MKIAICDDEKTVCTDLEMKLLKIGEELSLTLDIEPWYTGERLCDFLDKGNRFDIIFLDIELICLDGIDVGHHIRNELEDIRTQIIYISSKTNYALRLFDSQPFDFLVKPIEEKKLFYIIKKISKLIDDNGNRIFEYCCGRELCRIDYDDIIYFKSEGHKIVIILMHGKDEFYGKLNDIAVIAPSQFLQIHKSYLVNKLYVRKYTFGQMELVTGDLLNISKAFQKEVRNKISRSGREEDNDD